MTWTQVEREILRDPRLILPVGALDQHGPHLPLGAATFVAEAVAAAVSDRLRILRAPTFSYGVTLPGGPWPGTAGLRRKTFHRVLNELMARWEDHGVREFVVISAHRYDPHLEAVLMAFNAKSTTTVFDLSQIDVSDLVDGDPSREHGGELETSLLLHLAPDRVRAEALEDLVPDEKTLRRYTRGRVPTPPYPSAGVVGRPSAGSAARGAAVFGRWVDAVSAALTPGGPGTGPPPGVYQGSGSPDTREGHGPQGGLQRKDDA